MSDGCTFLEKDGYCLKYYGDGLTYYSARTVCRRDGGELLRIDNPNKQTTVERILSKTLYIFFNWRCLLLKSQIYDMFKM